MDYVLRFNLNGKQVGRVYVYPDDEAANELLQQGVAGKLDVTFVEVADGDNDFDGVEGEVRTEESIANDDNPDLW